jgi:GDP-L-fucose synthase
MDKSQKIFIAGHRGLVGSAILRRLKVEGFEKLITRSHAELELTNQSDVEAFFYDVRPEFVFLAAAHVGGIHANSTYPAEFIYSNIAIQTNIIHSAWRAGVKKLLFLGSSCIYPKQAPQPISEKSLLSGPLEETNEWYAVAKIAGIKMCQAYRQQYSFNAISLMPTNLYGPGDNFHPENSHVMPAMIQRFHKAKVEGQPSVTIWGTGTPRREFLYADDLAEASVFLMQNYDEAEIINVGTGKDVTIMELAELVKDVVGFNGDILNDSSKPDGTMLKRLDISHLAKVGWTSSTSLRDGLELTYQWYMEHKNEK